MIYQATHKYLRASARKIRVAANAVSRMQPAFAVEMLGSTPRHSAELLKTVISAAIANAKHKQANPENLKFKSIEVNNGPFMKRFRAVSRGRAHGYKKRMTHIKVVLEENNPETAKNKVQKKEAE